MPVGAAPAAAGGGMPAFAFKIDKLSREERITGIATLVLFISLFLPWFTYNFGIGTISVDGLWHGWMYLTLILCLAVMVYLVLRAGYAEMPFKLPMTTDQLLLIGTGISFVLTILAFVDKPGGIGFHGIGWGFGAFVGLIASVVAVAPLGWPLIQKQMNKGSA
jgi:hypothetical protein